MSLVNYIGSYETLENVWESYPEGGKEGDYLYINEVLLHWDKFAYAWIEPKPEDMEGVDVVEVEDTSIYNKAQIPVIEVKEEDIINDSSKYITCLGVFESLQHVWDVHSEGGKEGDYIYIGEELRYWNKYSRSWVMGVAPESSQLKPIEVSYAEDVVGYSEDYINYLGSFENIEQAWEAYPNGGRDGDFILVNGEQLRWNKYISNWGEVDMSDVTPARPVATVYGDLHVHNDVFVGEELYAQILETFSSKKWVLEQGYISLKDVTTDVVMSRIVTDNTTIAVRNGKLTAIGGNSGGAIAWSDITGKPVWIGNEKPKYTLSEITDDSGDNFITLLGEQSVVGIKDFTNGAKFNGALLRYDITKKCWVFPNNVVIEGDIAWHSNLEGFEAKTITDAVDVDWKTIGKNEDGQLCVIGDSLGSGVDMDIVKDYIDSALIPYAKKSTSLSGYGIIDAYTQNDADIKFIDFTTNYQNVQGLKNFKNGLLIGGKLISYSAEKDAFILPANLIVEKEVAWNSSLEGFDVPTIMDAVIVDNVTITKENGVLTVIGGTSGGGVADSVAWSNVIGKPTTLAGYGITDAYTKDETNTAIDTRINAVVAGAPANYDTLKEIADVLAGNVNSIGDIMSVLGTKWTQDDSLIANWNAAYSWGNHAGKYLPISGKAADSALLNGQGLVDANGRNGIPVSSSGGYMEVGMAVDFHRYEDGADFSTRLRVANGNFGNIVWLPTADGTIALTSDISNALASYITLGTNQDVAGVKNFVNGFKVSGVFVTYNAEKKAFVFPANAIFEGEVAWNSSVEGFDVKTITDAVQVDGTTIAKVDGVLKVVGGAGGGLDETQLAQYLTANNYAKKGDITTALQPYALATAIPTNNNQLTNGAGYITASALGGYATQEWVNNKGYISGISSSMVTTALGYTPYNASNFTKANIKSTLGISDWALASSKPTYNWSEIDSRPTALSQFSNDSGYITSAALSPYALSASLANYLPISGGTLNGALTAASTISANSVIASTGRWRVNASDSTNNFGYMRAETYSSNRGLVHIGSNYGGQSDITSASADVDAIGIYRSVVGVGRTFSGQELYDFYNSGVKLAVVGGANISRFLQANEQIAAQFYHSNIAKSTGANTSGYFRWGAFDEVGGLKLQFGADSGCKFEIVNKAWNLGLFSVDTAGNVTASGEIAWNSSRVLKNILNGRPTYLTMSEMLKIRPYRYTWKDGRDKKVHAGGIADEVLEVLPEVIITDSKGIHSMDYGQASFTVATSLTPYVSRHEREIKALRRKVRELETQINRLTR